VIAIGAVESKISRFVSAREHGHPGFAWSGPLSVSQPIRYGVES
jgi:hypothetical protein